MSFNRLKEDLRAFMERDPAARSRTEIFLFYPGFHALLLHRVAHGLWWRGWHLPARLISHFGRFFTSIEIHPGARIGRRVVIDHGIGVVIGETSEIEDDVTLYQGVTLGGIAPAVNSRAQVNVKRHPTLRTGAIIGSGAQVLGPIIIGENARVGANSVITQDVEAGMTAVGIPGRVVMPKHRQSEPTFAAYGTMEGECPDPIQATIDNLRTQMAALQFEVERLRHSAREQDKCAETTEHPTLAQGAGASYEMAENEEAPRHASDRS